jgi:hypothetical protein
MECATCPFCPLVKANVQICNYELSILVDKKTHQCYVGLAKSNPEMGCLTKDLITIAFLARNNYKLKPGKSVHKEVLGEYEFTVFRKNKDEYKVCFHALR